MPSGDVDAESATPGELALGDRYELGRLLGTGGSGAVYLAHDRVLRRDVAVKLLRSPQDDLARARLDAEARHAAAIAHPGVAGLLDVAEGDGPLGATPYLVMEYVEGRTLRDLIRSGERLSTEQVLSLVTQIADAIAAVHAAGIVHRDLKPGNIMLTDSGRAVLLDFGIARHHDGEPLTMTGMIIGTVDYISPEQASGTSASAASDVYALGMVAYECLTGILPLSRDTQVSTLMAHAGIEVPPLPVTVPVAIRELVESMVALEPGDRPTSTAVATRAQELLHDSARLHVADANPARSSSSVGLAALLRSSRRRHRVAAACAVLVALAGGLVLEGKGRSANPAAADVTAASPASVAPTTTKPQASARPAAAVKTAPPAEATRRAVAPSPKRPARPAKHAAAKHPAPKHAVNHGHGHGKGKGGGAAHPAHGKGNAKDGRG